MDILENTQSPEEFLYMQEGPSDQYPTFNNEGDGYLNISASKAKKLAEAKYKASVADYLRSLASQNSGGGPANAGANIGGMGASTPIMAVAFLGMILIGGLVWYTTKSKGGAK